MQAKWKDHMFSTTAVLDEGFVCVEDRGGNMSLIFISEEKWCQCGSKQLFMWAVVVTCLELWASYRINNLLNKQTWMVSIKEHLTNDQKHIILLYSHYY